MCFAFRSQLLRSALSFLACGAFFFPARAVDLPSGTAQIILQSAYPGEASFTLPMGGSIISADTPILGNNAQTWSITNYGLLSATAISSASGLQLGSAIENQASIINYGIIQSAGTVSSAASGVRFTNGGQVTNQAGASISGFDGIHTDSGSVLVNNFGTITGNGATGIYSGVGALVLNRETGTITGRTYGVSCNGPGQCIVDNRGLISSSSSGLNFVGSSRYSLVNEASGVITSQNRAILFSGSNGQFVNKGLLESTNANTIAVTTESNGNVYVNAGIIRGGPGNGSGFLLTGNGNTVYNLGVLTGPGTAISLTGDANTLVLGTQVTITAREIDVTGPGSSITGSITATGAGNAIRLTDTGTESTPFTGFATLTMAGENWVLSNSFALNGTDPTSLSVNSGRLLLNGGVATDGGATITSGGVLMVGDADHKAATLTAPVGFTVNAGGTLGGDGAVVGNVLNGGTLTTAAFLSGQQGAFTIRGDVTNGGVIVLASGAPGNTMTITGNLISASGRMVINTALGGDASPSDRLILDGGRATGITSVVVQDTGTGQGLQTAAGIRIVETINGATTASNSFALDPSSRGYRTTTGTIAAGAFDYSLVRGGSNGVTEDWYLTSLVIPTPVSPGGGGSGGNGGSGGGGGGGAPSPPQRVYRPEAGLYLSNQVAARTMFLMTLRDRDGYGGTGTATTAGWARVTGSRMNGEVGGRSLKLGADSMTVQAGMDLWQFESSTYGVFRFGIMGGYGTADTSASSRLVANYKASGSVTGYSLGLYGTWWQNGREELGAYVDIWAQHGWFDNDLRGNGLPRETYNTRTRAASVEVGYRFELMRTSSWRIMLEPQAQAIYSDYQADALTENSGTHVRFRNGNGPRLRLGGRLSAAYTLESGGIIRPYLEANWWHNADIGMLQLNQDVVRSNLPRSFAEIKVGAQGEFVKNWSIWGQLAAQTGENRFRQFGGQLGLKYVW